MIILENLIEAGKTAYDYVVDVKEAFEDIDMYNTDWDGVYRYVHQLKHRNVKLATAIVAVLHMGTFVDGAFMLPATKDCMNAYKQCQKDIDKCKPIYIWTHENEYLRHKLTYNGLVCNNRTTEF